MTYKDALHSYRIMAYMLPLSVSEKVVEALEKQIPKKPTLGGAYKINEWECPNCKSYFAKLNDRPRHCVECGQVIDWSKENEN